MAKHSGISHAAAAVTALVAGEFFAKTLSLLVGEEELRGLVDTLVSVLTVEGVVYARESTVEGLLLVFFTVVLSFVWGYTYHVKRHG